MDDIDLDTTIYDFVDIKEQLQLECVLAKSRGFSFLAKEILEGNLNEKEKKEYQDLLFDCFYKYGDVSQELILEFLPIFLEKSITTREQILQEFTLRIDKIDNILRVFPAVLNASIPSFSCFLTAASKIDPDLLTTMFVGEELQTEHYRFILVLIFSGILNDDHRRRLGNLLELPGMKELFLKHHPHLYLIEERAKYDPEQYLRDCPAGELEFNSLELLDMFQKLRLMHERPSVLRNENIEEHFVYLPFLFQMCRYLHQITAVNNDPKFKEQKGRTAALLLESQQQGIFSRPDFSKTTMTMERFISHIVTKGLIPQFYKLINFCPESVKMFDKPYYMAAITSLLPHSSWNLPLQKNIVNWIIRALREAPDHAEGFILFFIGLFAMPNIQLDHCLIMDTITAIATKKESVVSVVKFISLYTKKYQFKFKALECLVKLVSQFPYIVSKVSKCINLSQEDEEKLFRSNMELAVACCLATDENDDIVAQISECLKDNGFRLASAVDATYYLAKDDVLDFMRTRKQLQKKVKFLGNELAFSSYCRLLSLGSLLQDDESEEDFHHRKKTLIQELYEYTKHQSHSVASEAWKSIGSYPLENIAEALNLSLSSFGEQFKDIPAEQRDGFIDFLKQLLEQEKESYQRPFYNIGVQKSDVPPLMLKVDTYKDQLNTKNKDKAWFCSATLPLSASILQLAAPSNKVQLAVRILKACLVNVPPADSRDGMLRLMASWRICVRESFNVLFESKNNDILWARDHICQEGRLSLTQKSESVDNIMMMLTALVDVVEDKLRVLDDQKQVDAVAKAQKPWIISVFEFVATRLPKEMKEKREQKVNPIYQVMTQSNKSSLHTAIFCANLLRRHPSILEFYREEKDFGLVEDKMLISLFDSSEQTLEKKDVPNGQMVWITAEAYGADELTVSAFESRYREIIDEKTNKSKSEPSLVNNDDIEVFFEQLTVASRNELIGIQQKNRKIMEKLWTNGSEEIKRKIYIGLSELALISGSERKKSTISIEKLADSSVLKGILQIFDQKSNTDPEILRCLIQTFINHKRNDGRFLPPVDWLKILNGANWKETEAETRIAVITLACEQNVPEVIFHFADALVPEELYIIADHFPSVIKMMPRRQFVSILNQMVDLSRKYSVGKEKSVKLAKAIADFELDPIVHEFLKNKLPKLIDSVEVIDALLNSLKNPMEFCGSISTCFDVWLEARNGENMNIKSIMDILSSEDDEKNIHSILAILSMESRRLTTKHKIGKILDLITVSRITRSSGGDLFFFFPVFLSIIVSLNDDVDIPVCYFRTEHDVIEMMNASREPFFNALLKHPDMRKVAKHFGSFLRPYVDGDEKGIYETWQKKAAIDMLRSLVATFGPDALEGLWQADDLFWQSLLPVE